MDKYGNESESIDYNARISAIKEINKMKSEAEQNPPFISDFVQSSIDRLKKPSKLEGFYARNLNLFICS